MSVESITPVQAFDEMVKSHDGRLRITQGEGKLPFDLALISRVDMKSLPEYASSYFSAVLTTLTLKQAAEAIDFHPATIYAERNRNPIFDKYVEICLGFRQEAVISEMDAIGYERALGLDGKKPSDQLIMFYSKANAPGKYREKHQATGNGPISVNLNFSYSSDGKEHGPMVVAVEDDKEVKPRSVTVKKGEAEMTEEEAKVW